MSEFYYFNNYIGGTNETYVDGVDGDELSDADAGLALINGERLDYLLDADSAITENSPYVIAPDDNAGDKRWIAQIPAMPWYYWCDDFDQEASGVQLESGLTADFWTTAGTNYAAANVTFTANSGGTLECVTAGADDDSVTIIGVGNLRTNRDIIFEVRFRIADISNVYVALGVAEGAYADKAAPDDDIVCVGIDSDNGHGHGADSLVLFTNDNGGGLITDDLGVTIANLTWVTIRVDMTDTEQPVVWVNRSKVAAGNILGHFQNSITVAPYIMVQSLSAAADTILVDYIKAWQRRF